MAVLKIYKHNYLDLTEGETGLLEKGSEVMYGLSGCSFAYIRSRKIFLCQCF